MRKLTKKQKKQFFFLLFFLIPIIIVSSIVGLIWMSPVAITKGDLIKNFRFVSYTDNTKGEFTDKNNIDSGKLAIDIESTTWTIENTVVIDKQTTSDGITKFHYEVYLTNAFNFYTNVPITEAYSSKVKREDSVKTYTCKHYSNCDLTVKTEKGYLYHDYYSWGSIPFWTWNDNRHIYGGEFKFDFDINDEPYGAIGSEVVGDDGDVYEVKFAYISVREMKLMTSDYGSITYYNLSDVAIDHQSTGERAHTSGADGDKSETRGSHTFNFDVNARFNSPYVSDSWDAGVELPGDSSAIDFLTKEGELTWNPEDKQASMKNCSFVVPMKRLSPYVTEYSRKLKYDKWELEYHDACGFTGKWWESDHSGESRTKPSALVINNRNIQARILMVMDIWSAFELVQVESGLDGDDLDKPDEYYDQLAYSSAATGLEEFTKTIYRETWLCSWFGICGGDLISSIFTIIIIIIIVVISIVALVVIVKIWIARKATKTALGVAKKVRRRIIE